VTRAGKCKIFSPKLKECKGYWGRGVEKKKRKEGDEHAHALTESVGPKFVKRPIESKEHLKVQRKLHQRNHGGVN